MIDRYENIAERLVGIKRGIADTLLHSDIISDSGVSMRLNGQISSIGHAAVELKRINGMLKEYPIIL